MASRNSVCSTMVSRHASYWLSNAKMARKSLAETLPLAGADLLKLQAVQTACSIGVRHPCWIPILEIGSYVLMAPFIPSEQKPYRSFLARLNFECEIPIIGMSLERCARKLGSLDILLCRCCWNIWSFDSKYCHPDLPASVGTEIVWFNGCFLNRHA